MRDEGWKPQDHATTVEGWNDRVPVWTAVRYYPIAGRTDCKVTRTRSEAWPLGDGTPVVSVEGVAGGVSLAHVEVDESRTVAVPWWLHFQGRPPSCVEAPGPQQARELGAQLGGSPVVSCWRIPYPAEPRLNRVDSIGPDGTNHGPCPSFCHEPDGKCRAKTACPQRHACDD